MPYSVKGLLDIKKHNSDLLPIRNSFTKVVINLCKLQYSRVSWEESKLVKTNEEVVPKIVEDVLKNNTFKDL